MDHAAPNPAETSTAKEPWLAAVLSACFPGLGQFYAGEPVKGTLFAALQILFVSGAVSSVVFLERLPLAAPFLFFAAAAVFPIFNIFDAYGSAIRPLASARLKHRKKQPFLSLFLSLVFPGLGQLYNRQVLKALLFFGAAIAVSSLLTLPGAAGIAGLLLQQAFFILIAFEAFRGAERINAHGTLDYVPASRRAAAGAVLIWFIFYSALLPLASAAYRNFVTPYKVPTGAMLPLLAPGDRIFADNHAYDHADPQRGETAIFRYPLDPGKTFIKRVIGLPGERIELKEGRVYVNGDAAAFQHESYYYNVVDSRYGKPGQTIEVPQGMYFVLGDNSAHSSDSRSFGFVPRENFTGKAVMVWWPPSRIKKIESR